MAALAHPAPPSGWRAAGSRAVGLARLGVSLRGWHAGTVALVIALLSGCGEELEPDVEPREEVTLPPSSRLARVEINVTNGEDTGVEVRARFGVYRGMDATEAAARASVLPLLHEFLSPGECVAVPRMASLTSDDDAADATLRELSLLDAGDLRVAVVGADAPSGDGDTPPGWSIPVALVPDLVPWVSGVEYLGMTSVGSRDAGDELAVLGAPRQLDRRPAMPLQVDVEGTHDDELPGFSAEVILPAALAITSVGVQRAGGAAAQLQLAWEPARIGRAPVFAELQALDAGATAGATVLCSLDDAGTGTLDFEVLRTMGFGDGDSVRVALQRIHTSHLAAGHFDDVELVTTSRAVQTLTLPR